MKKIFFALFLAFLPLTIPFYGSEMNYETGTDLNLVEMPILVFDLKEGKVVDRTSTLFDYETEEIMLSNDEGLSKRLENIYKGLTQMDIKISQIFISKDERYAYVHSYLYAHDIEM